MKSGHLEDFPLIMGECESELQQYRPFNTDLCSLLFAVSCYDNYFSFVIFLFIFLESLNRFSLLFIWSKRGDLPTVTKIQDVLAGIS